MKIKLFSVFFLIHTFGEIYSQSIVPIPGWSLKYSTNNALLSPLQNVPVNKTFIYQIRNKTDYVQEKRNWFANAIASDMQREGWTEIRKGKVNSAYHIQLYVTEIEDVNKIKWYVYYLGYLYPDKKTRMARIVSVPDFTFFQSNATVATKHFSNLTGVTKTDVEEDGIAKKDGDNNNDKTPDINSEESSEGATQYTALVKGSPSPNIHTVLMHLEYEMGVGGSIYPSYHPYILYDDGTIYGIPVVSPKELNVTSSRKTEPKKWGTWKVSGNMINTYWPYARPKDQHDSWETSSYKNALPAKKGETLNGFFKTITGTGNIYLGGSVSVVSAETIGFNTQGKFTLAKVAGVTSHRDFWETTNSKSDESGTYKLDGYTIELKYNNGKIQRRFFYFYPDSHNHFGIGASPYMPMK